MTTTFNDPIDHIVWRPAAELKANHYNPNIVFKEELRLLEHSLVTTGWMQPLLANPNDILIDGYHRWRLAQESPTLLKKYGGFVPTVTVQVDDAHAKTMTVRINRAKGSHVAIKMNGLVRSLIDEHGMSRDEAAREMGMTGDEVDLLYQQDVFSAKNIKEWQYSKAWLPAEVARN
jgi:ParB-like chromosome segregation protein Spo0J